MRALMSIMGRRPSARRPTAPMVSKRCSSTQRAARSRAATPAVRPTRPRWRRWRRRMKVLLIEDDEETSAYIARGLREQGHVVDLAAAGRDGLFLATDGGHDVLIVDRMLPGLDGFGLVQTLRQTGVKAPVLFLTALGGVGDRVRGLEAGGDDYLVKPFAFAELLARVNALARRPPLSDAPTVLRASDLEMDLLKRTVLRGGK